MPGEQNKIMSNATSFVSEQQSSYYHSPIIYEGSAGLLLPFFYSTYYCRDKRDDSDPATDKMLDPVIDLLREMSSPCKTLDIEV